MRNTIDIHSNDNALFTTSQCNNRCLMCCQPPTQKDDIDFYFKKNLNLIDSAPANLPSIGITGGEPTLLGDRIFDLLNRIKYRLPETEVHLLTNGRFFADINYTRKLADCHIEKLLLGIPIHSDYAADHDKIAGVKGAYYETMRGLYNLARYKIGIELRIVLTKQNHKRLPKLVSFIYRNLPFVEYVSLMGLEYTGYVIKNNNEIWIEPDEYAAELEAAVIGLADWKINVSVFNLPLCLLKKSIWGYARKSISDWKNIYAECCNSCCVKDRCCGLFGTSKKLFDGIRPL